MFVDDTTHGLIQSIAITLGNLFFGGAGGEVAS